MDSTRFNCSALARIREWRPASVARHEWMRRFATHLHALSPPIDDREGTAIAARLFVEGGRLGPEQAAALYALDDEPMAGAG